MLNCSDRDDCGEWAVPRRNRYFYGQLLDDTSLQLEQDYLNGKRRLLNRLGLGVGVLCGLSATATRDRVRISPGVALDGCGREIVVGDAVVIDPWQTTDARGRPAARLPSAGTHEVFFCVTYVECPTDYTPVLVSDCDAPDGVAASRVEERYAFVVRPVVEGAPPPLVSLPDAELCNALATEDVQARRRSVDAVLARRACAEAAAECVVVVSRVVLDDGEITHLELAGARPTVYSNPELFEMLMCRSGGTPGPAGPQGPEGPGIDAVTVSKLACEADPTAALSGTSPHRTLALGIPAGCDGAAGRNGAGISQVDVQSLPCTQPPTATLRPDPAHLPDQILTLGIPGHCDSTLTKITALNWVHDGQMAVQSFLQQGLEITFSSNDVVVAQSAAVSANGWLQVSAELWGGTLRRSSLWSMLGTSAPLQAWWMASGMTLGAPGSTPLCRVHGDVALAPGRARFLPKPLPYDVSLPVGNLPWQMYSPYFHMTLYWLNALVEDAVIGIRVNLKADFLLDRNGDRAKGARAVDGNHLGGRLPTGDGVQGGEFESWFTLGGLNELPPPPKSAGGIAVGPRASARRAPDPFANGLPDVSVLEQLLKKGR